MTSKLRGAEWRLGTAHPITEGLNRATFFFFFNFTNDSIKENVYDNNIIELYCFITSVFMVSSFIDLKLTS